jgi:hypothetical protein
MSERSTMDMKKGRNLQSKVDEGDTSFAKEKDH